MPTPRTIFKYEAFTTQSLQNLKAQSLYFGSPRNFNDPYDCAIKVGAREPTDSEVEQLRKLYLTKDIPEPAKIHFRDASVESLRKSFVLSANAAIAQRTEEFLTNSGVTCFSENNNDLLMWSHYGGRCRGFCLEFSTEIEPFNKIRQVKYVEEMPKLNVLKVLSDGDASDYVDLFCTKSIHWAYEKEWRFLHKEAGLYTYSAKALKAVYFGPDIELQALEIICLILAGQNPDVEIWQGKRSEEKFEVTFERKSYLSNVEAKRLGLLS